MDIEQRPNEHVPLVVTVNRGDFSYIPFLYKEWQLIFVSILRRERLVKDATNSPGER